MNTLESVKKEILDLYARVPEIVKTVREEAIENIGEEDLKNAGRPFIVGVGSGYAAAFAAKTAFRDFTAWSGEYVYSSTPIRFSGQMDENEIGTEPSLITINVDGADGCQKAAERAIACGGRVISLTVDGSQATEGGEVFTCENGEDVCGAAEYVRGLSMAIGLAEAEGLCDGSLDDELIALFDRQLKKTCVDMITSLDFLAAQGVETAKALSERNATSSSFRIPFRFAGIPTSSESFLTAAIVASAASSCVIWSMPATPIALPTAR